MTRINLEMHTNNRKALRAAAGAIRQELAAPRRVRGHRVEKTVGAVLSSRGRVLVGYEITR